VRESADKQEFAMIAVGIGVPGNAPQNGPGNAPAPPAQGGAGGGGGGGNPRKGRRPTPGQILKVRSQRGQDPSLAGEGWRALSALYTAQAESRTGRLDIMCVVAPDATGGVAPGTWSPLASRIELDGNVLPGAPDTLDPALNPDHHKAFCALHGVFVHEVGHAVHTLYLVRDCAEDVREEMLLLEEIRMEAQSVRRRPSEARFLRACANFLIVEEQSYVQGANGDARAAAFAATLMEGRVVAGSLKPEDVHEVSQVISQVIDAKQHQSLERIWQDTVEVPDDDLEGLERVARRLHKLFPPQPGSLSQDFIEALIGALEAGAAQAASAAVGQIQIEGSVAIEQIAEAVKGDVDMQERLDKALKDMREDSGKAAGAPGGAVIKAKLRPATAEERRARNKLAALLRKARWRDRDSYRQSTELPPGRLRTRLAVQRSAQIAHGKVPSVKPWRQTKRQYVEMPRLRVGILVDTSGSMSGAAPGVSSSLWVIANAVADAGGKSAAYAFGDSLARILDPGKPPPQVLELKGQGGTAFVPDALQLSSEALDFNDRGGPRLMIIVSDGMWTGENETLMELERLRKLDVKTIHVMIGGYPSDHGTDEICAIKDASDLAEVVGNACIRALKSHRAG
jgi:hypothetical protein